jgi:hypothetical protein
MDKDELELLKDIPVLEGELEWVIKVIDSPPKTMPSVIGQLSSKNDTAE